MGSRRYSNKLLISILFLLTLSLILAADAYAYAILNQTLSTQDILEFDRQLTLINKPAIKSFKTEDGDIFDCVDIYKQHAFDHPLLKNHKIQIRPTNWVKNENITSSTILEDDKTICPKGTTRVKRMTREELIFAKTVKPLAHSNADEGGYYNAGLSLVTANNIYGGRGTFTKWSPSVADNQFSLAGMWLVGNTKYPTSGFIQAGWMVNPSVFGPDKKPRLFVFWTNDGHTTQCYNMLCPGFVQVSRKFALGQVFGLLSKVGGQQYEVYFNIERDGKTGDWWLRMDNEPVGYWPKDVVNFLGNGASKITWGGQTFSPVGTPGPPMGSGRIAEDGFQVAAFVKFIMTMDRAGLHVYPRYPTLFNNLAHCYNAVRGSSNLNAGYVSVFYGGPGC